VVVVDDADLGGSTRRPHLFEELDIGRVVLSPLRRNVIFVVNRFHWAHWFTGATVNTLIGVDVEHPIAFIDAIDRALINTGAVFDINTRQRDYVCHEE
jgi:hypothetical protein